MSEPAPKPTNRTRCGQSSGRNSRGSIISRVYSSSSANGKLRVSCTQGLPKAEFFRLLCSARATTAISLRASAPGAGRTAPSTACRDGSFSFACGCADAGTSCGVRAISTCAMKATPRNHVPRFAAGSFRTRQSGYFSTLWRGCGAQRGVPRFVSRLTRRSAARLDANQAASPHQVILRVRHNQNKNPGLAAGVRGCPGLGWRVAARP